MNRTHSSPSGVEGRLLLPLLVLLLLAACSTPLAQLKKDLGPRASDTLGCPEKELKYKELDRMISSTKVQITGCGKTVTYKLVESRWQQAAKDEPVR